MFVVFTLLYLSIMMPNVSILLEIGGAVVGTLVNIVIPVLFYNRAFSSDIKNLLKEDKNISNISQR